MDEIVTFLSTDSVCKVARPPCQIRLSVRLKIARFNIIRLFNMHPKQMKKKRMWCVVEEPRPSNQINAYGIDLIFIETICSWISLQTFYVFDSAKHFPSLFPFRNIDMFFFSINVELLNLQHVPANWMDKEKNEQEKCSIEWNVFFASTTVELTVVDSVRHIHFIVWSPSFYISILFG